MSLYLSKSRFCSAVQCPKMLWLKQNKPEEFSDDVMDQNVLNTGSAVGDLAMGLFGPFVEVPLGDLKDMLRETERLLDVGTPIIAEASFSVDGNFCSVDILKNLGNKQVEIYEVKSSTSISDIYLYDAGYQYYVLNNCGYEVGRVWLVTIDNTYVRMGDLELDKLFAVTDVTEEVLSKQTEISEYVDMLCEYMEQTDEPQRDIGAHCFAPYSCGFFDYCTREWPHPNIFDIASLQNRSRFKLMDRGIRSFEEVEADRAVNDKCMLQVEHELHDVPDHINAEGIISFMDTLSYPLYFLDFESFQPAVPLYDNSSPYEQIVFQYSLHYILEDGGELYHKEFLAYPGEDPRRAVAEHLCEDIPKDVCVLGTGGASRAILQCVKDMQAHSITVISRVIENAPEDIRAHYTVKTYEDLKVLGGDLLINCTPVGMFPKTDASPVDGTVMDHFAAAVDIIYNPAETKFMKLARQQGKTAVNGLFMLVAQAVAAEEIWLGRKLDEGLIADVTAKIAKLL